MDPLSGSQGPSRFAVEMASRRASAGNLHANRHFPFIVSPSHDVSRTGEMRGRMARPATAGQRSRSSASSSPAPTPFLLHTHKVDVQVNMLRERVASPLDSVPPVPIVARARIPSLGAVTAISGIGSWPDDSSSVGSKQLQQHQQKQTSAVRDEHRPSLSPGKSSPGVSTRLTSITRPRTGGSKSLLSRTAPVQSQVRLPLSLTVIGCPPLIVDHRVDHSDAPAPVAPIVATSGLKGKVTTVNKLLATRAASAQSHRSHSESLQAIIRKYELPPPSREAEHLDLVINRKNEEAVNVSEVVKATIPAAVDDFPSKQLVVVDTEAVMPAVEVAAEPAVDVVPVPESQDPQPAESTFPTLPTSVQEASAVLQSLACSASDSVTASLLTAVLDVYTRALAASDGVASPSPLSPTLPDSLQACQALIMKQQQELAQLRAGLAGGSLMMGSELDAYSLGFPSIHVVPPSNVPPLPLSRVPSPESTDEDEDDYEEGEGEDEGTSGVNASLSCSTPSVPLPSPPDDYTDSASARDVMNDSGPHLDRKLYLTA